jgi:hypothetical protein
LLITERFYEPRNSSHRSLHDLFCLNLEVKFLSDWLTVCFRHQKVSFNLVDSGFGFFGCLSEVVDDHGNTEADHNDNSDKLKSGNFNMENEEITEESVNQADVPNHLNNRGFLVLCCDDVEHDTAI